MKDIYEAFCVACYITQDKEGKVGKLVPATFVYKGASLCKDHMDEIIKVEKEQDAKMKAAYEKRMEEMKKAEEAKAEKK